MRRKGIKPMHAEHINVTPLIDVIMCLIIFFLLCGQFAKDESKAVALPFAQLGQEVDKQGQLLVNVVAKENPKDPPDIYVGATKVTPDTLSAFLYDLHVKNADLKVMIRADMSVTYDHISPILVSCAQANITSVNFSTRRKD
ncbi:MAG TPA: biopolymer transporter ExbD [Phycisphaerae bacterium]|jgi:biopolymer transport protein ExbD|nr:biopolymer transporter ExbD [Phycisphaerae bacterium]